MELKVFFTIFAVVFVAELGDKTQIATMLFASDKEVNKLLVFAAASAALVVASAIGVLAGSLLSAYIDEKILAYLAGTGFMVIGAYTLYQA
jgi:putative Ca2+/H+ antiporter (TMEM165/GDT1 family)